MANKPKYLVGKAALEQTEQINEAEELKPVLWIPEEDDDDIPETPEKKERKLPHFGMRKKEPSVSKPPLGKHEAPGRKPMDWNLKKTKKKDQKPEQPVVKSAPETVEKPAAERIVQPVVPPVVEKPAEPAPKPVVEKPVQPVVPPVMEKPAEPAPKHVVEKPAQPVVPPVVEKPAEPAPKPAVKKPAQSAAQSVAQKLMKSAPKSGQPVEQKPAQPAPKPMVEKPAQPMARSAVQKPVQSAENRKIRPVMDNPGESAPQTASRKAAKAGSHEVPPNIVPKPDFRTVPPKPVQSQPKRSKGQQILWILLGILIIPASSLATAWLVGNIYQNVGRPKVAVQQNVADMAIFENFDAAVSSRLNAVRDTMRPAEQENMRPEDSVPEETLPPVRKQYWIDEGTLVAPEPNQSLFGRTDDPAVMEQLLKDAQWLLDGQTTYFQPDQKLYEDSIIRYYLDDSILAITWQEVHDGSVYTFSEVKVSHPSQFRRHLAGGEYGSDMQYLTTEMAESVNAVVASAGDFYRFRNFGAVVYQGEAKRVEGTYAETCYIDAAGDLHFTYGGDVLTVEAVQSFVDERDIQFSLAFGPVLVDDYQEVPHTWYGVGEINEGYARAALLQMDTLHYIVVTANTTGPYQEIPTVEQFRKNIAATGCRMAYCLDGGQTATIVMNDNLVNRPVYGQQRKISDIIYFATAVPEGGAANG